MDPIIVRKIYEKMYLIRKTEEAIAEHYPLGKMRCPTHLSIGQEAVAAAAGEAMTIEDLAVSTHRCHAHYLGKGGSLNAMIAELHGKVTGCSHGKGGSMHLIDESVGFMGSTAIVANSIPLGVGLALSIQIKKCPNVSIVFFGDGAIEEGAFYEAANFAVLKKLPVIFICENNLYSVYSPLNVRQPEGRKISSIASAIGLEVANGDGNDAIECFGLLKNSRMRAVSGNGPQFLELSTYRWREHCGPFYDNNLGYRSEEEFEYWRNKDPIPHLKTKMLGSGILTFEQIERLENKILRDIENAFIYAENSQFPNPNDAFNSVFKYRSEKKSNYSAVIPAKAGIQLVPGKMGPCFRRDDTLCE